MPLSCTPKLFGPRSWFIGAYSTAETSSGQLGASTPNCLPYEAGSEGFRSYMLLIVDKAQVLVNAVIGEVNFGRFRESRWFQGEANSQAYFRFDSKNSSAARLVSS